jgi:hypothetical protein
MIKVLILILLCFFLWECTPNKKSRRISISNKETQTYMHDQDSVYNADSTMLLKKEVAMTTPTEPFPHVSFSVVDVISNKTIYVGSEKNATVEWYDNQLLQIKKIPGTVTANQKPEDHILILNPINGTVQKFKDFQLKKAQQ